MKTYYIVEEVEEFDRWKQKKSWAAYRKGILSMFNCWGITNRVMMSRSYSSADECEYYLKEIVGPQSKAKIVRVVTC